jgi:hypothetical protein
MAVQKNFVVQNGIEVNKNLIFANSNSGKVGIATTNVQYTLHVNGGIGATDLKVTGVGTFKDLVINGRVTAGSSLGISGQYLISTGAGVTWASLPSVRTVDTQIATAGQTTFTTQYLVGLLDVYINGVRLSSDEYTATNSIQVILDYACFGGETVEFVSYSSVAPGAGFTGIQGLTILDEGIQVGNPLQVSSINFVGYAVTSSGTGMAVTVYSGQSSQWATTGSGIHTTSNVGVGTTNPQTKLHVVGSGNTALLVEGDVRIVGVLTVGSSSITLDGINNVVSIGTAILGDSSGGANYSGIVTAFKFVGDGSELTNVGSALSVSVRTGVGGTNSSEISNVKAIRFNSPSFTVTDLGGGEVFVNSESTFKTWYVDGEPTLVASGDDYLELIAGPGIAITTRNTASGVGTGEVKSVTITSTGGGGSSQWVTTGSGIHTTSNVGIGTTNPQTKLEINGVLGFNNSNVRIGDNTTGANLTSGYNNILMGIGAGSSLTYGQNNFFAGNRSGKYSTSSDYNTFIGEASGEKNYSGNANVFIGGFGPGYENTTGEYNVFFSGYSGSCNTSGSYNNFLGGYSGENNTIGSCNNFFGYCAGHSNITGNNNVFLGSNSGFSTTSSYKVIIGSGSTSDQLFDSPDTTKDTQFAVGVRTDANPANYWIVGNENFNVGIGTTNPTLKLQVGGEVLADRYLSPNNNVFLGTCSGHLATGFGYNNFFGYRAGAYSSESSTTAIGCCANYCGSGGGDNNFIGYRAGAYASECYSNAIGYCAAYCATGSCNIFFGCYAGTYNTGCHNNFIGKSAGSCNTGNFNFAGGYLTGKSNTGCNNNFIGTRAGAYGTGSCNNFMGYCTGKSSTGSHNNFFGWYSGCGSTGSYNNFFGYCSGHESYNTNAGSHNNFFGFRAGRYNTTGDENVFIGRDSGESNTTGILNIAIGKFAADCNTIGSCNTFLGFGAGYNNINGCNNVFLGTYAGGNNESGEYNNFLGYQSGDSNITGSYNSFIGHNVGLSTSASNKIIIGRGNSTYPNYFDSPDTTKDTQLAIGIRTDANPANYWIVGNENFNVGIGTTNPQYKLDVGGDINASGIISATSFVGDGSNLTNVSSGVNGFVLSYMF